MVHLDPGYINESMNEWTTQLRGGTTVSCSPQGAIINRFFPVLRAHAVNLIVVLCIREVDLIGSDSHDWPVSLVQLCNLEKISTIVILKTR